MTYRGEQYITYDVCRVSWRTWRRFRDSNGRVYAVIESSADDFSALCEMLAHDWLALVNLVADNISCPKGWDKV